MKPAIGLMLCLLALGGCKVHETSVAESTFAGRYFQAWAENGKKAEFLLEVASTDPVKITGTYSFTLGSAISFGTVSGTNADSLRLTFTAEAGSGGSFAGEALDHTTLQGRLFLFNPGGNASRTVTLRKTKYQY